MKRVFLGVLVLAACLSLTQCGILFGLPKPGSRPKIIDHQYARLSALGSIPNGAITAIRENLHVAYGHTSHGSQVTDGMTGLAGWSNAPGGPGRYAWNDGGVGDALDLRDRGDNHPFSGSWDLGGPDRTAWAAATRTYLDSHPEVNVVMWSWCGQADTTPENIELYLDLMTQLEEDYPGVAFIYMTGHLVGSGEGGNLNQRNEQIREYCRTNDKWLYDFADIESYDPDGNYYLDRYATDGCNYDYNSSGGTTESGDPAQPTNGDRNWALDWQENPAHAGEWYTCDPHPQHTQPLNANLKAYAAWYLFARLAGWDGD